MEKHEKFVTTVMPSLNHPFGGQLFIDGSDRVRFEPSKSKDDLIVLIEDQKTAIGNVQMELDDFVMEIEGPRLPVDKTLKRALTDEARELLNLLTSNRGPDYHRVCVILIELSV